MEDQSDLARIGLYVPNELSEQLKRRAKDNGRSLNKEVLQILKQSLKQEQQAHKKQ